MGVTIQGLDMDAVATNTVKSQKRWYGASMHYMYASGAKKNILQREIAITFAWNRMLGTKRRRLFDCEHLFLLWYSKTPPPPPLHSWQQPWKSLDDRWYFCQNQPDPAQPIIITISSRTNCRPAYWTNRRSPSLKHKQYCNLFFKVNNGFFRKNV